MRYGLLERNIKLIAISLFLSLFVLSSAEAGTVIGRVIMVQVGRGYTPEDVYALVETDGDPTGQSTCATDPRKRFAINPATKAGKALLALLTTARVTNATVEIWGSGNCDVMSDQFESIQWMRIRD